MGKEKKIPVLGAFQVIFWQAVLFSGMFSLYYDNAKKCAYCIAF